ncbi:hypothetical protein QQ020_16055 [Fulvivirgaceae bacterium BMA12]|uniref:TonB-dependent receptor n=1 Tax=Agaribacillus aureus TaxID=3051825 RepID=A0ABT8L8M1_9BACT|nr:hypothetical protein [Fulvivirgaceae bacterium BMA12]
MFFLCCLSGLVVRAQEWEDQTGEIEDAEIVIEKDKKIELPPASRLYEKISPLPLKNDEGQMQFQYKDFNYQLTDLEPRIRVLTIKDPLLKKLYANYLKAGIGNFASAHLEAYVNSKRNENFSYSFHGKHASSSRGPVDKKNSGAAENFLGVNGKAFYDAFILGGNINYQGRKNHFYGYDQRVEAFRDTIEQKFNNFYVDGTLETRDTGSDFYFKITPSFSFLKDNFDAKESKFGMKFKSTFSLDENIGLDLGSYLSLTKRTDGTSLNRNLFKVRPSVNFKAGELKVNAGLNIVYENDTIAGGDKTHLYLSGSVTYDLNEDVSIYGGIDGDIEEVNLHTLVNENPFINAEIPLVHSNKELELYGGIKGSLFRSFTIKTGFSLADYENLYFFINDPLDTAKFNVVYDAGNTTAFNFFGEFGVDKTNIFRGAARFDFYAYSLERVDEPWHRPTYKFSLMGSFNLFDKILFSSDLYTMGGIKAKNFITDEEVELDPIVDLNFKVDYRYSDQVSMFLNFNNVLSKNYERYYNYPSRGFMLMVGLTYAFDRL